MRDHTYEVHHSCARAHCPICDGGLAVCTVCGCLEGALASECPGVQCYATHADDIYAGRIDFIDGQWRQRASKYSPSFWRAYSEAANSGEPLA